MIISVIRTFILYLLVVAAIRIMGKRQIGEMQPSELVVAIMISDLATIPMQDANIPFLSGVVPVLTLLVAEVFMSYLCLKSVTLRRIFTGEPSIVIYGGKLVEKEMRKLRFSISDLMEQLRISGCASVSDVDAAVLETNGQLSVFKKREPLTAEDVGIKPNKKNKLPFLLVMDGDVNSEELKRVGKDKKWLEKALLSRGVKDMRELFIAEMNADGEWFLQRRDCKK